MGAWTVHLSMARAPTRHAGSFAKWVSSIGWCGANYKRKNNDFVRLSTRAIGDVFSFRGLACSCCYGVVNSIKHLNYQLNQNTKHRVSENHTADTSVRWQHMKWVVSSVDNPLLQPVMLILWTFVFNCGKVSSGLMNSLIYWCEQGVRLSACAASSKQELLKTTAFLHKINAQS